MRTLIVFAKEPRPGRVKTRLATEVGEEFACRAYQAFVADLAEGLGGLPGVATRWWVDGDPAALRALTGPDAILWPQEGGDLGERMARAFDHAFEGGAGPAVVVGTDCPLLGPEHLEALYAALAGGADAALLPADDGGYAALGLARPAPEAFRRIPWSTERVCAATLQALERAGRRVAVLPPLFDVDTARDLARLAAALARDPAPAPRTARLLAGWGAGAP